MFVQSQLDYFLVSRALEYNISYNNIKPGLLSEHSLVNIELTLKESVKRGKGTWKFNNNLLCDKEYIALIKDSIQKVKNYVTLKIKTHYGNTLSVKCDQTL